MASKKDDGFSTPAIRYHATHLLRKPFTLNRSTDSDIISWLDCSVNFQGYIKALLRADMTSPAPLIARFIKKQ